MFVSKWCLKSKSNVKTYYVCLRFHNLANSGQFRTVVLYLCPVTVSPDVCDGSHSSADEVFTSGYLKEVTQLWSPCYKVTAITHPSTL